MSSLEVYLFLAFALYGVFSQYFILVIFAYISVIFVFKCLWKPYTPPVLFLFLFFHWTQVFCTILYADFKGRPIDVLFKSKDIETLFSLTFLQIVIGALVLGAFVNKQKISIGKYDLGVAAGKLNEQRIIIGYLVSAVISPIILASTVSSSLFQLAIMFITIKYVFICLMVFLLLLTKPKNRLLIIGILLLDFILSFSSYFSDFKTILFIWLIIYATINPYIKANNLYRLVAIIIVLIAFFSFWSYVKDDYREYISKGKRQQVVAVSTSDALGYLGERLSDFNGLALREGASIFLLRLQYMEQYCRVFNNVPDKLPHRNGADFENTIEFLLVPRVINANKEIKDASKRTQMYTNRRVSTAAQGTSISMGYFCDLYIDFGLYIMILPLIFIFFLIGSLYKWIMYLKKYNLLLIYSMLIGIFLSIGTFESDIIYFLGSIRNYAVFVLLGVWIFFKPLNKFITKKA